MIRSNLWNFSYFIARQSAFRRCSSVSKRKPKQDNSSFLSNIFVGKLELSQAFPYPDVLSTEQKELTKTLTESLTKFFNESNDASKNDKDGKIDEKSLTNLWELGAFGIQVPDEYGGLGLNNTQYAALCEIVGANDLAVGITLGAHQSIGFKGILLFGNPSQKQKYLPKVSSEKIYAAFALTEPSSGSDAASIRARVTKTPDGNYVLNGSKIWISNGGIADIMTVFAQLEMSTPSGEKKDKVTAFIVERSFGGVSSGPSESKMGIKASNTTEVYFENVLIPKENLLGEEGEGFKIAMNILNNGRFGMGASLSGTMKYCIQKATEHANERVQFGKKLKEYGSIQEKLARMNMYQYVTESMAYTISQNMDSGSKSYQLEAATCKIFASEAAWFVCDEAIQILGGMGFMREGGLERVMRDLRIFRIFEGTNDILRLFVALTGIQNAGSHLKELKKAIGSPGRNAGVILKELLRRMTRRVGFTSKDLCLHVVPDLQTHALETTRTIDMFGKTIESLLIKYGERIIHEQLILNNLANAAIDIYAMIVTLSRASRAVNLKLPSAEHEVNLTKIWCLEATERCSTNLNKAISTQTTKLSQNMKTIAESLCENDGVFTTHVLNNE